MPLAFALIFFVSGAAALVFETLWFHQIGLLLGNSVWSTALVLTGFMAGLGIGNGLAARLGGRTVRPARVYALLELLVGATGLLVVLAVPRLNGLLLPLLRACLESPALLTTVRLGTALALLVVPTTAMGATLPLLVRACIARAKFGETLGILYGANAAGAVAGAIACELALLPRLGVRGSATFAAALNLCAALGALRLSRRVPAPPRAPVRVPLGSRERSLLAAGFVSGAAMLALEVVWFRFLLLFVAGTTLTFALMLAAVLAGIGGGSLLAGRLLRTDPSRARLAPALALVTGALVAVAYAAFRLPVSCFSDVYVSEPWSVVFLAASLALPAAAGSGVLFTMLGAALERRLGDEARATGLFTLANTAGAALGALLGGFVLLPGAGMEASLATLALSYGLCAVAALPAAEEGSRRYLLLAGGAFALAIGFFPFGAMERVYLRIPVGRWERAQGLRLEAVREGLTETLLYFRASPFGVPSWHRLVTNGFSMSSTNPYSTRYMKLFVWLPVALRPAPRDALLISFGVGMTAEALTATGSLAHIDVVELSREILQMRSVIFRDPTKDPLRDPRVSVHVEDGRFFLETTPRLYDLITAEPPPPKLAGVVNLYSQEYFGLLRDRLRPGGIASYWLPVHNLLENETRSVVAAFCGAFADCTLWAGEASDWILVGSRGGVPRPSEEAFSAPFRDPNVAAEMARMGIERPEELGALFLADAPQLRRICDAALPLTDDFPRRVGSALLSLEDRPLYAGLRDAAHARAAFVSSAWVRTTWPAALRERSFADFETTAVLHRATGETYRMRPDLLFTDLDRILTTTRLAAPVVWMLSDPDELAAADVAAARGAHGARLEHVLGAGALSCRAYGEAARRFSAAAHQDPRSLLDRALVAYALGLSGDVTGASRALSALPPGDPAARWITATLHLPPPPADQRER